MSSVFSTRDANGNLSPGFLLVGVAAFVCLSAVVLDGSRSLGKLYGDEATYLAMTESLARGFDLTWDPQDYRAVREHFPGGPEGVVLTSSEAGVDLSYGKPFIYSLICVPFYMLLGPKGFCLLNALLFSGLIWMTYVLLRPLGPPGTALVFSILYLTMSASFPYTFRFGPDVFIMFAVGVGTYCWFRHMEIHEITRIEPPAWRVLVSGLLMGLAGAASVVSLILALPGLGVMILRKRYRPALLFVLSMAIVLGACALGHYALTGTPVPWHAEPKYRFDASTGYPEIDLQPDGPSGHRAAGSIPKFDFDLQLLVTKLIYALIGRHTGVVLYFTPCLIALGMFVAGHRFEAKRTFILLGILAYCGLHLAATPADPFAGAVFVGNRHFLPAYLLFAFLIIQPLHSWTLPVLLAAGGLFMSRFILTVTPPAALPRVVEQHHAGDWVHALAPFESTQPFVEGAQRYRHWRGHLLRFLDSRGSVGKEEFVLPVPSVQEVLIGSPGILGQIALSVQSGSPGVVVDARMGRSEAALTFSSQEPAGLLVLEPSVPLVRHEVLWDLGEQRADSTRGKKLYWYKLRLRTGWASGSSPSGAASVVAHYLGLGEEADAGFYTVEYGPLDLPRSLKAGEEGTVALTVFNKSQHTWRPDGAAPVAAVYRFVNADGNTVAEGAPTPLPGPLGPGESVGLSIPVVAPSGAGKYRITVDLRCQGVSWFSSHNEGRLADSFVTVEQ